MLSIRSATMIRCLAREPSRVSRFQPLTTLLQQRGLATHSEAIHKGNPRERRPINTHSPFDVDGKVFVVTGGGQGLGLSIAQGLVEAGGIVHVLDMPPKPKKEFEQAKQSAKSQFDGVLEYHQADVTNADVLGKTIASIAAQKQRLDGLVAAAGIQKCVKALDYKSEDIAAMLAVNYTGVFLSAQACAREMLRYKIRGSMCLVASMSGTIANRGLDAPVYNSSKAAVVQLARNLAMEFGRDRDDGSGGIRVNSLSPGHILTPMVEESFRRGEADPAKWNDGNMLGRISTPEEYRAVALFMLSNASSYMTGHDLKIDGGTTAW